MSGEYVRFQYGQGITQRVNHPYNQKTTNGACESRDKLKTAGDQKPHQEQQEYPVFFVHDNTGKRHKKGHPSPQEKKYDANFLLAQADDVFHQETEARLFRPEVGAKHKNRGYQKQGLRLFEVFLVIFEAENYWWGIFDKKCERDDGKRKDQSPFDHETCTIGFVDIPAQKRPQPETKISAHVQKSHLFPSPGPVDELQVKRHQDHPQGCSSHASQDNHKAHAGEISRDDEEQKIATVKNSTQSKGPLWGEVV